MISQSSLNASLLAEFSSVGFTGSEVPTLCTALSTGIANHLIGKTFTTNDIGTIGVGSGVGSGIGITVNATTISNMIFDSLEGKGFEGSKLRDMSDAIGNACSSELALATLTSNHSIVILGSGTVVCSSIPLSSSTMASLIIANAPSFQGDKFVDLANGVSEGLTDSILNNGTANVTITLVPGSIPISPGSGTGTGIIT